MGSHSAATTQLLLLWLCVKGAFANSCQSPIQRVPFLKVQAPVKTKLASFHVPTGSLLQNPEVSSLHGDFGKGATVALPHRDSDWTICLPFFIEALEEKAHFIIKHYTQPETRSATQQQPALNSPLVFSAWLSFCCQPHKMLDWDYSRAGNFQLLEIPNANLRSIVFLRLSLWL